jgi:hypothetical protein
VVVTGTLVVHGLRTLRSSDSVSLNLKALSREHGGYWILVVFGRSCEEQIRLFINCNVTRIRYCSSVLVENNNRRFRVSTARKRDSSTSFTVFSPFLPHSALLVLNPRLTVINYVGRIVPDCATLSGLRRLSQSSGFIWGGTSRGNYVFPQLNIFELLAGNAATSA